VAVSIDFSIGSDDYGLLCLCYGAVCMAASIVYRKQEKSGRRERGVKEKSQIQQVFLFNIILLGLVGTRLVVFLFLFCIFGYFIIDWLELGYRWVWWIRENTYRFSSLSRCILEG